MTIHAGPGCPLPGKTYYGDRTIDATNFGVSTTLEGTEAVHENFDAATFNTVTKVRRNTTMKKSRLVRNTSGGALLPGDCVKYDALFHGRRVVAAGAADEFAGVVDEYLPATGVKDDDLFWITTKGESMVNKVAVTVYADGDLLATGAAKDAIAAATIDVDGSHVGRCVAAAANPTDQVLAYINAYAG